MYLFTLFRLKILTGYRLLLLLIDVFRHGIQLTNVLRMCIHQKRVAVKHRKDSLSYDELLDQIESVAGYLHSTYSIKQGSRALLILDNSIPSIVLLFAVSSLGCNVHVVGGINDSERFTKTIGRLNYDFIFAATEEPLDYYRTTGISFIPAVWNDAVNFQAHTPFVKVITNVSIFTSGTTGVSKNAKRTNTLWQYLPMIADLVETMNLQACDSVILPVPIYHSYGLSACFLSLMLNKKLILVNKFDVNEVAQTIQENDIHAAILIPQMLAKLTVHHLRSLQCILCCADVLPTSVFEKARNRFGDIIFNLYGTSETGLATIATPQMLAVKPDTIGRPIKGCTLKLVQTDGNSILHLKSGFAMRGGYINTGDVVTQDEQGWFYYHGRVDHMMIVNGINVYPTELIEMAHRHESVEHVAVGTFSTEEGFKKIKLVLRLKDGHDVNPEQFRQWWFSTYGSRLMPSQLDLRRSDAHFKLM